MIIEPFRADISHVGVVVPARNEQSTLGACLRSIRVAGRFLQRVVPTIQIRVLVVLDCCTDESRTVVEQLQVTALVSRHGRVGAARRLGVDALVDGRGDMNRWWIACTDADSVVPQSWLADQVRLSAAGADLVLGAVLPSGLAPEVERAWSSRHDLSDGHGHVFGANMGFRADRYLQVGGFPDIATGEDVGLAEAIRRSGAKVVAAGDPPVLTSGRRAGRAPGGLSRYLRELADDRLSA